MTGDTMNDAVQRVFERMRREYLDELPARLDELAAAAAADDREAVKVRLHQLAGSGGSHGFPAISAVAREIERALAEQEDPLARTHVIDHGLVRLHAAVADARESLGR